MSKEATSPPTHNENAERALIGCLILDCGMCMAQVEAVHPDPAELMFDIRHKELFKLLQRMSRAGKPVSLETVVAEMLGSSLLSQVGGIVYLSECLDSVPSALNLKYWLNMVVDCWVRRDLRSAVAEITEKIDDREASTSDLVSMIEERVGSVGKAVHKESTFSIKDEVISALEYIEAATHADGGVNGLSTGFSKLDRITGGLHPGKLYILAARPAMGKTSLAMNIVESVMEKGSHCHVFSLEMSKGNLIQRVVLSMARVNMMDLRNGLCTERDYVRMTGAAGRLSNYPIMIDDSPGLTIAQMRSRARREKQKNGTRLILIDYLQLANGVGRKNMSRTEEVGIISSGLKEMSKELDVPVIALSQLSRDVEKEKNRKPRLSDLRECLPEQEWVYTPTGPVRIGSRPDRVVSLDRDVTVIRKCEFIPKRYNKVFRVNTQFGSFSATAKHLVLTGSGWKQVNQLKPGRDVIASPRVIPHANRGHVRHAKLLGWLIGNGSMSGTPGLIYRRELHEEVVASVSEFGVSVNIRKNQPSDNVFDAYLSNGKRSGCLQNPVMTWLRSLGLDGCTAHSKFIPSDYLGTSNESHRELLSGLWEADGTVTRGCAKYSTVSELLANQVSWLLLTCGIRSTVGYYSDIWEVRVCVEDNEKMEVICSNLDRFGRLRSPSPRYIDPAPSIFVELASEITGNRYMRFQKRKSGGFKSVCKKSMEELLKNHMIQSIKNSPYMSCSELGWGRLRSVDAVPGECSVCDLSVPGTNNFVTNGIVVHNSGSIEQDADLIGFLHRPDSADHDDVHAVDLLIEKQRDGATGLIPLTFFKKHTRFETRETINTAEAANF
jgi:replicative DNA helicase